MIISFGMCSWAEALFSKKEILELGLAGCFFGYGLNSLLSCFVFYFCTTLWLVWCFLLNSISIGTLIGFQEKVIYFF